MDVELKIKDVYDHLDMIKKFDLKMIEEEKSKAE